MIAWGPKHQFPLTETKSAAAAHRRRLKDPHPSPLFLLLTAATCQHVQYLTRSHPCHPRVTYGRRTQSLP